MFSALPSIEKKKIKIVFMIDYCNRTDNGFGVFPSIEIHYFASRHRTISILIIETIPPSFGDRVLLNLIERLVIGFHSSTTPPSSTGKGKWEMVEGE